LTKIKASSRDRRIFLIKCQRAGEVLMYTHILLPTDGSALSERAIDHGMSLAKALGASVTGVTVSGPLSALSIEAVAIANVSEDYRKEIAAAAEKHLDVVRKAAAAAGVVCDVVHVDGPQPYQGIIDTARTKGCDVIVMASHGRRGLSAIVLGSETVKVLTHSAIPVVVCR
jgi:nucleotide-binding universal stress UspA family protein